MPNNIAISAGQPFSTEFNKVRNSVLGSITAEQTSSFRTLISALTTAMARLENKL